MKKMKRFMSLALAVLCALGCMTSAISPAFAANVADATIDTTEDCSITLYKYDFTNAAKDGVWDESYVSTGVRDSNLEQILGKTARVEDFDTGIGNKLGNGANSNGYAIKGVEFSYMKVAEIVTFTESENDGHEDYNKTVVLYGFDKTKGAALLEAIGLDADDAYANAANTDKLDQSKLYFVSDVLNKAMKESLTANATTVKNALEAYIVANRGTDKSVGGTMPLTSEDGYTNVTGLEVGLYLMVETMVPEMVTTTCNPFFLSLPMTSVDGGYGMTGAANATDGGHRWIYDPVLYPKNETGIVTLEKTVREAKADTGKNEALTPDTDSDELLAINDGYKHYATASTGDVVEYQILSTLPTITSEATNIAAYTFTDVLAKGLAYTDDDVIIEWFRDANCTDKVTTWKQSDADAKFDVEVKKNSDKSHTMTITMTDLGLEEINTANKDANNSNGSLYAGYSNYTMRITYSAQMNSNESMVYGDDGNLNTVVLTWKRTSSDYYDTLIDDCHVYSYGIDLTKEWSDMTNAEAEKEGMYDHVLFTVQNKNDGYYVQAKLNEDEGIWYVTGHTTKESDATDMRPVTWNGKDGQLVIKGLEDDEYILTEVETANTYTLLKDSISVVITATDDETRPCEIYGVDGSDDAGVIQNDPRYGFDGGMNLKLANIPQAELAHNMLTASATVDTNKVTMLEDESDKSDNALVPLTVTNTKGFDLPKSGQDGIKWMPIIGGSVIGLSALAMVLFLVLKRNKEEEEEASNA